MECEIASKVIAKDILGNAKEIKPLHQMVVCFGDMGKSQGFYMHR